MLSFYRYAFTMFNKKRPTTNNLSRLKIQEDILFGDFSEDTFYDMAGELCKGFGALSCSIYVPDIRKAVKLVASTIDDEVNLKKQANLFFLMVRSADTKGQDSVDIRVVPNYYTELWECLCVELGGDGITYGYLLLESKDVKTLAARILSAKGNGFSSSDISAFNDYDILSSVAIACRFKNLIDVKTPDVGKASRSYANAELALLSSYKDKSGFLFVCLRLLWDKDSDSEYRLDAVKDIQHFLSSITTKVYILYDDLFGFVISPGDNAYGEAVKCGVRVHDYITSGIYGVYDVMSVCVVDNIAHSLYCCKEAVLNGDAGDFFYFEDAGRGEFETIRLGGTYKTDKLDNMAVPNESVEYSDDDIGGLGVETVPEEDVSVENVKTSVKTTRGD